MFRKHPIALALLAALSAASALAATAPKEATAQTQAANAAVLQQLPFADQQDFADAQRGFVGTLTPMTIQGADGKVAWDLTSYDFIKATRRPRSTPVCGALPN